jgi:hypothetical protein
MINSHPNSPLGALLKVVWRRQQLLHQTGGLLAFCRWGLLVFLLGLAADWLLGLPSTGRFMILGMLFGAAIFGSWRAGWNQLRRFDASRAALQVEKQHGALESLLVTAVQLGEPGSALGASEALREKTCREAEEAVGSLRSDETVSYRGLRRPGLLTIAPVLILTVLALVNGPFLEAGLGRIFTPWLLIEYPTKTQVIVETGDVVIKEGDSLRLYATLAGELPEKATLILRTGSGKPRERSIPVTDRACEYSIEAVFRSFEFCIAAGDARSRWHSVRVISSPRIERAKVSLEFPEYTQRPAKTLDALTLTVPEGTRINWTLTLDRALGEAEFRPAGAESQPMQISDDGRTVTIQQAATGSRSYSFGWVDRDNQFAFASPNHFLQVAPDQAPGVDLTSPNRNLFATLGRKIDLAYRCRDDHGIGEATLIYRVNKTEESRVPIPVPELSDGTQQQIDWNYLEAIPGLKVGDSVSFAIELADRYPGQHGYNKVRSTPRTVSFLTKEDYLVRINNEKRRLLSQVRKIYLEEREVHDFVRNLDPAANAFLQACQLEAVRQDLIRDRLGAVHKGIDLLVADIKANNVEAEAGSASLIKLGDTLQAIADGHVGRAASLIRDLAVTSDSGASGPDLAAAVDMINSSARELGLVVFQLGFAEGADAMSRELHATVQTQISLRERTVIGGKANAPAGEDLAKAQAQLASETARLLAATPRNKESTKTEALVAFKLSRMVNGLIRSGTINNMNQSAALIAKGDSEQASRLQSEVISALLQAEFRLRFGAKYEALTHARDILTTKAAVQKELRDKVTGLSKRQFSGNQALIAQSQAALHQQLQLLLVPEVPANRPGLFNDAYLPAPPVDDLLAKVNRGSKEAVVAIEAGNKDLAAMHQRRVETSLASLVEIISQRIDAMTQEARIAASVNISMKQASRLMALEDRLLGLLEQSEDAAYDNVNTAFLAPVNQTLAEDTRLLLQTIGPSEDRMLMIGYVGQAARDLDKATPLLKENNTDAAIAFQEQALDALKEAGHVIAELTEVQTAFAEVLTITDEALIPSPLLKEIEAEQAYLKASTEAVEDGTTGELELVIAQKNLIHAVNSVLDSLDSLAHRIESGTALLFAKADMKAAAVGLETGDVEESLDAQSFIIESLQELQAGLDEVTPRYRYVREFAVQTYELKSESARILSDIRQMNLLKEGDPDSETLQLKVEAFGSELKRLSGEDRHAESANRLVQAIRDKGDVASLKETLNTLRAESAELQVLIKNLAYLITPPVSMSGYVQEPDPQIALLEKVLDLAAHQQDFTRDTQAIVQEDLSATAPRQRELADQLGAYGSHPQLATAHIHMESAAAALAARDRAAALTRQKQANDALRHFVYEYALNYVMIPPPGPPLPPGPPDDDAELVEQDFLPLFEPGALTGNKPKGGRLEWEVLGRRDRAALNENFARELPLEYREILKDYYERLTHDR